MADQSDDFDDKVESCQKGLSRKEFIRQLVRKSIKAGVLFTAVSAVRKFDLSPAYGKPTKIAFTIISTATVI